MKHQMMSGFLSEILNIKRVKISRKNDDDFDVDVFEEEGRENVCSDVSVGYKYVFRCLILHTYKL